MKKLFLTLFTLLSVNMSATAQYNQRPNGDHYLTPDSYGTPIPLDVYYYDSITGHIILDVSKMSSTSSPNRYKVFYDIAQPCYSDTLLTIIGVSGMFTARNYNGMNGYLHIADTGFNVYRTLKIPQTEYEFHEYGGVIGRDSNYTEMFFEQPINVKGRFLVIWDNPKPNAINVQYDYDYNYSQVKSFANLLSYTYIKDADAIYEYLPYQRKWSKDTLFDWEKQCEIITYVFNTPINQYPPCIYYLFPIFGELVLL